MCIRDSAKTQDAAVNIPSGFEGGALDFASSPFSWAIFHLTYSFKWIGSGILVLITLFLMVPVSYTHLDVYKRQVADTFKLKSLVRIK